MANVVEFILQLKDMMSSSMQKAAATARSSLNTVATSAKKVSDKVTVVSDNLKKIERKHKINIDDSDLNRATSKAENLAGWLKKGAIAYVAKNIADTAIAGGSAAYGAAMDRLAVSRAINVTTHGQGADAMSATRAISDRYGLNYDVALEGVKTLTGGLMRSNMPLAEQMRIFEGVSTGVAALGLDAETTKGAFLALGQMASKGTVSAEELRGQLGERIPGAFGIAARAMNVTEAELGKMMQKGEIAASDFLPRFAAEMQRTFGADALKNANGPAAIQQRFNNVMSDLKVTVGQGLLPVITPMLSMLTEMGQRVLPVISGLFDRISRRLPAIKSAIWDILAPVRSIKIDTASWSKWLEGIRPVLHTIRNYFVGVGTLIMSILSGVIQWLANSQILKDVFYVIGSIANVIYTAITWVVEKLNWVWTNVISRMINGIERAYRLIRNIEDSPTDDSPSGWWPQESSGWWAQLPRGTTTPTVAAAAAPALSVMGTPAAPGSEKMSSKGVTHTGPKAITINFNREFIGEMAINSYNIREGIGELEERVREAVYRIFYSLETENG